MKTKTLIQSQQNGLHQAVKDDFIALGKSQIQTLPDRMREQM
ncbi:hypothetical protein [Bacillus salipaludis]|uniref:Uncharacterized protein n=1 Tax=Bacillus salipaludis TaxID=2547811 RepID=A0ABW8RLF0_9BACI